MFGKNNQVTLFALATFIFLLLLSFVPEVKLPYLNYRIKGVHLFSDIQVSKHIPLPASIATPLVAHSDSVVVVAAVDTMGVNSSSEVILASSSVAPSVAGVVTTGATVGSAALSAASPVTAVAPSSSLSSSFFEDYSPSQNQLQRFVEPLLALQRGERNQVRIGFLGDSFIEGDIMTDAIRAHLQARFGGRGVGFVPISHISSRDRLSIKHTYEGWKTYSMAAPKEADKSKLFLSGYYFKPQEGATVLYQTPPAKKRGSFSTAQLLFINEQRAKIRAVINDSISYEYLPDASAGLQAITIREEMQSVRFQFDAVDGLVVYGAYLEDGSGVCLDNFSMRGTSGTVLEMSDALLTEQWRGFKEYDVLVLQYGLNVISKEQFDYGAYRHKMVALLEKLKRLFPHTLFVVMGIGDRGSMQNGEVATMPEVYAILDAQRAIAKESEVLFWDTFSAMGGANSIVQLANSQPPLANKDYVHLNRAGGRMLGKRFVHSLEAGFGGK
ncbi:MAG: hypothetical protein ACRCUJ_11230 [Phocaeicola sp.]